MLLIEAALVLIALLLALLWPTAGESIFLQMERRFSRLARKRALSILVVGASALAIRVALLPALPVPKPAIHDEFSYLLAADTFAHWRVTNPPHPMWVHFETFHVIQQPTYASMYYPAQGLFLAAGQIVFHHPFWGVCLSSGLMCAAICWMLQAWVSSACALLGGLLAVVRIAAFSYWDNSYWGGAVAALGGALILGALPRIMRAQRVRDAVLMGIGLAVCANSRPYETVFFALPVIVILSIWLLLSNLTNTFARVIVPLSLVIVITAALMGYYDWRVTGNPLRTPYMVDLATYNSVPYFPWRDLKAPRQYHHPVMQRFYLEWWKLQYQLARQHPAMIALLKLYTFWMFFLGPLLTVPFVIAMLRTPYDASIRNIRRRTRILLCVCGSVFAGMMLPVYFNPHYVAAVTAALYGLLMISLQQVRRWKVSGKQTGMRMVRAIPVIAVLLMILRVASPTLHIRNAYAPASWCSPGMQNFERAGIISELSRESAFNLILVRYTPDHTLSNEWVYNGADIDGSKIVWARDMGTENNAELLRFFAGRRIWLVEPDVNPAKLIPYSETQ